MRLSTKIARTPPPETAGSPGGALGGSGGALGGSDEALGGPGGALGRSGGALEELWETLYTDYPPINRTAAVMLAPKGRAPNLTK